ncbi:MAG: spondin domain-containing protein, partial [Actinomycetota bacterium]
AGDVTDQVTLWDAGTEIDQTPGEGADQAPRQAGPNTGDVDPNAAIRPVDGFDAANYIRVILDPQDDGNTVVRIENVSANASVPGPIAPVAWVVHDENVSLFTEGAEASAGLEILAEDGGPADLVAELAPLTGVTTPFAPIAYVAAPEADALFVPGTEASAGLEILAEDGGPGELVAELEAAGIGHFGAAAIPEGADEAGPAFPGQSYTFEFVAHEGDYLNLASMLVQSNDWFVALRNVALFDGVDPISGDLTDQLRLYDAGTELDQAIGAGPDQAPRQAGPDTGAADENSEIRGLDVELAGHLTVSIEVVG